MTKRKAKLIFLIAVLLELIGNFAINYTDGFANPGPSILCLVIYGIAGILFGLSLTRINLGVAYALWTGVGILFLAVVSVTWFHMTLMPADIIGLVIITIGVVGLDLFGTKED